MYSHGQGKKWIKKVEVEVNFHLSIRLQVPEVYLELCQTLKMGLFAKIVINWFHALTFSQKLHLLDTPLELQIYTLATHRIHFTIQFIC